jgi:arylsulfatase A-like enzyme
MVPALLGEQAAGRPQRQHDYLYWEFPERGFSQAVRQGDWKAVRNRPAAPLELYDLSQDIGEAHDLAARHPDVVAQLAATLDQARTPSDNLPVDKGQRQ